MLSSRAAICQRSWAWTCFSWARAVRTALRRARLARACGIRRKLIHQETAMSPAVAPDPPINAAATVSEADADTYRQAAMSAPASRRLAYQATRVIHGGRLNKTGLGAGR